MKSIRTYRLLNGILGEKYTYRLLNGIPGEEYTYILVQ